MMLKIAGIIGHGLAFIVKILWFPLQALGYVAYIAWVAIYSGWSKADLHALKIVKNMDARKTNK